MDLILFFPLLCFIGFVLGEKKSSEAPSDEFFIIPVKDKTLALNYDQNRPKMVPRNPTEKQQLWNLRETGYIESVSNPGRVLNIKGGMNGSEIITWAKSDADNDKFDVSGLGKDEDGVKVGQLRMAKNKNFVLVMSANGGVNSLLNVSKGNNVQGDEFVFVPKNRLQEYFAKDEKKKLEAPSKEVFILSLSNKILALESENGLPIFESLDPEKKEQLWILKETGHIESVSNPGKVFDIKGGMNGSEIVLWTQHTQENQKFDIAGLVMDKNGVKSGQLGISKDKSRILIMSGNEIGSSLKIGKIISGPIQGNIQFAFVPKNRLSDFLIDSMDEDITETAQKTLKTIYVAQSLNPTSKKSLESKKE